jgi:cyclopropane fatty-acyl-phospholipid synthase-like methyltransferase
VSPSHEDLDVVREYFAHWEAYERAVRLNYIHHRESAAALRAVLVERGAVGSLLDLGCGDAAPIPALVADLALTGYTGVDVTPEALVIAERNLADLGVPVTLIADDFARSVPPMHRTFDTIVSSLAMHHLPLPDLPAFLTSLRAHLAPGGVLLLYEPASRPGEDRSAYVARQADYFRAHFTGMTSEQVEMLIAHVAAADHPQSPGTYAGVALDAGFARADVRYVDPQHFWAALALYAG